MDIFFWVNYNALTVLPNPGFMMNKGNHPQMAELFRLVNYYNLPRYGEILVDTVGFNGYFMEK
jgi:hypothetical protein